MKLWECTECGREVQSENKPRDCGCGARGKWRELSLDRLRFKRLEKLLPMADWEFKIDMIEEMKALWVRISSA